MTSDVPSYHGYRFPPEIISHAVPAENKGNPTLKDGHALSSST